LIVLPYNSITKPQYLTKHSQLTRSETLIHKV